MAIQEIKIRPCEKGMAVAAVAAKDEEGIPLIFEQVKNPQWQLMRHNGDVIDGCSFSDSALTSFEWVLKGSDLAYFGAGDNGIRVLTFTATYDSTAGNDLPLNCECYFILQPILGVVDESA